MFVGGHSPEEVWILVLEAGVDRALGAVGHHHGAVVLAHPGDGLHSVGAGGSWPHARLVPSIALNKPSRSRDRRWPYYDLLLFSLLVAM